MKALLHACDSLLGVFEGEGIFEVATFKEVGLVTPNGEGGMGIFKICPCGKLNPGYLHERQES